MSMHHRELAAQLEARLAASLQEAYGVDIQSGHWQLNLQTGAITLAPESPQ